jgi:hypothetical protein
MAVAAVAGVISYSHIYELTVGLHQSVMAARLMPFGVDGLIVTGSVVLLQSAPGQRWLGWLGIGPGVAISLFANVESGIRYGWLAAVWAGIPAVSFFLACFILENWIKAQAQARAKVPAEAEPATEVAPVPLSTVANATAKATPRAAVRAPRTRQGGASKSAMERRAKTILARQPGISGAELGRAIGASPRTGQRLLASLDGSG